MVSKKDLIVGKEYCHVFHGKCIYSKDCECLETKIGTDPSSIFMKFDSDVEDRFGNDIIEVSLSMIEEYND